MLALGYFSYIVLEELQSFIRDYEIVIVEKYSMKSEKERKRVRYEDK